jgi:hypothetical protein
MASSDPSETGANTPKWRTPKGASPRGLRSDAFITRSAPPPRTAAAPEPEVPDKKETEPVEPRDWAFGVPEPARRSGGKALIEPDANLRNIPKLRNAPAHANIPNAAREKFCENWERMEAAPPRQKKSRMRRRLEKSKVSGWLFTGGRFEVNAAAGALMLAVLLVAAFFYGRKLLTNGETKPSPPARAGTK